MICIHEQEGLQYSGVVSKALSDYLKMPSVVGEPVKISTEAFNPLRNQYEAARIIDDAIGIRSKRCDLRLVLVDVDIYAPRMNFIFGLAEPLKKTAVVSIYRLVDGDVLRERIAKEVIHEVGHLVGLDHCSDPACVMFFSNTVKDTDEKNTDLCSKCRRKFEII